MQVIFKKYDLRGIVGQEFNISDAYDITRAIITYFKKIYPDLKNLAVGMDGRISSPDIKTQVCRAIVDSGLNAHFIGLCTTPALYFACHTLNVEAGIMITASHNPKEYNGFKLVLQKESVWGEQIEKIYEIYCSKSFIPFTLQGNYYEHELIKNYIDDLVNRFSHLKNAKLNLVIDCGNGSAGVVIPQLIQKLKWENATILYPEINGEYPHHEPNPVELKNMLDVQKTLNNHPHYELGIGFDGDCDRVAAMTKQGDLIAGDLLLGLFGLNLAKEYSPTVILDSKCSDTVTKTLNKHGVKTYISPTGFAYIKSYLKIHQGTLGGELSGHFCFKDRYFGFDDGIYAMLRLCEILINKEKTLNQLVSVFPKSYCSPEFRIACNELQKKMMLEQTQKQCSAWPQTTITTLDGVRVQTPEGWFLIRPANTEPMISLRIEGNSAPALEKLKLDLFTILAPYVNCHELAVKMDLKISKKSELV